MQRIVVVLLALALLASCAPEDEATPLAQEQQVCEDSSLMYRYSQQFVIERLRNPDTAEFPDFSDPQVTGTYTMLGASCRHSISGYVLSQNGIGAVIRTEFTVEVLYNPATRDLALVNLSI